MVSLVNLLSPCFIFTVSKVLVILLWNYLQISKRFYGTKLFAQLQARPAKYFGIKIETLSNTNCRVRQRLQCRPSS